MAVMHHRANARNYTGTVALYPPVLASSISKEGKRRGGWKEGAAHTQYRHDYSSLRADVCSRSPTVSARLLKLMAASQRSMDESCALVAARTAGKSM